MLVLLRSTLDKDGISSAGGEGGWVGGGLVSGEPTDLEMSASAAVQSPSNRPGDNIDTETETLELWWALLGNLYS